MIITQNKLSYLEIGLLILSREKRILTAKQITEIAIRESFISPFNKPFAYIQKLFRDAFKEHLRRFNSDSKITLIAPATYELVNQEEKIKLTYLEGLKNYILKLSPQLLYSFIGQYLKQLPIDLRNTLLTNIFNYLIEIDKRFIIVIWQTSIKIVDNSINMNDLAIITRYYSINNEELLGLLIDKLMQSQDFIKFTERHKNNG